VEWDDEKVGNFWSEYSKNEGMAYFTELVGHLVLRFVKKYISLGGTILDYGCGRGQLMRLLLLDDKDGSIYGCDFSKESVDSVTTSFKDERHFGGCEYLASLPSPFPSDFFSTVFLIETIEHLTKTHFDQTLIEISRVTSPGGFVVVTTPNQENLTQALVRCPDCGAIFHRYQHMQSFSKDRMSEIFAKNGFKTVFCGGIELISLGKPFVIRVLLKLYREKIRKIAGANLIYIGKKVEIEADL